MSRDGEPLRNEPWRNAWAARGPYGHFCWPHDGFHAASIGLPPLQQPVTYSSGGFEGGLPPQQDGSMHSTSVFPLGPQLGSYATHQPSPYFPMEGSAPIWGAYPDVFSAPLGHVNVDQWQYQPAWGWYGPHLETHDRLDRG